MKNLSLNIKVNKKICLLETNWILIKLLGEKGSNVGRCKPGSNLYDYYSISETCALTAALQPWLVSLCLSL